MNPISEVMQYEIDQEAEMLEQIMPEGDINQNFEDLVDGIGNKEDEKYNWRHYFTHRMDDFVSYQNTTDSNGNRIKGSFGLKPDYYKDGGYICPSEVTYVGIRRAKNTQGMWKIIVNLKERYKGKNYLQHVRYVSTIDFELNN